MDSDRPINAIARELSLDEGQVSRALALLDDGNTVPFVARYRKEATGNLDEEQLRVILARADYLRKLAARQETVMASIEAQGKLTDALCRRIQGATTLQAVEDLYLPYKPKRRTRAMVARERGLEPLAEMMMAQRVTLGCPERYASEYTSDEVPTIADALAGAGDIVAETIAEDAAVRAQARIVMLRDGVLVSRKPKKAEDPQGKYRDYYEYAERLAAIPPHRVLALNRGEREKVLRLSIQMDDDAIIRWIESRYVRNRRSIFTQYLCDAIADGYRRLMLPAITREVRRQRTETAEDRAISVFGANLRSLLLQPPLQGIRVLGLDPGYRTGCKVAIVDETGKYLAHGTIYPHAPRKRWAEAKRALALLVERYEIDVIAIGNGTASRESEQLLAELIAEGADVSYVMASEAGASVYSASPLAARELPDLDVSIRGAVSIARRMQDPLSELVKIEPRSIGVGLYQHDVDQKKLANKLDGIVESAVNFVGVDVNTASTALLRYVSGLGARVADAVVSHRDAGGPFKRRRELLAVKGLGPRVYQQAAGFLRIREGDDPLDNTAIHPESYDVCHRLLEVLGLDGDEPDLPQRVGEGWRQLAREGYSLERLARELGTGVPTLEDIRTNLLRPGRDPREDLPAPILRTDVLTLNDLHEGMMLKGTVRNVVDFGAFVDIGVKHDGLVHVSQLADHFVRDPMDVVSVGDVVDVRVIGVDAERGRISLSMKSA